MKFELRNTRERRPSLPRQSYTLNKSEGPPKHMGEELFQERYDLKATVGVSFFSNAAQLPMKQAQAEKNLRAFLYGEAMPLVDELLLMAENQETHEIASRLKAVMLGHSKEA